MNRKKKTKKMTPWTIILAFLCIITVSSNAYGDYSLSDIIAVGSDADWVWTNPRILRIDKDGNTLYDKDLPLNIFRNRNALEGNDRNLTEDALYITTLHDDNKINGKNRIIKINASGDKVWDFPFSPNKIRLSANPVEGGIYVSAYLDGLYKIDQNGNVIWGPIHYDNLDLAFLSTDVTTGGVYIATYLDEKVLKIDRHGNLLWEVDLGIRMDQVHANPIDGGVIARRTREPSKIFRLDKNGTEIWQKYQYPTSNTYGGAISPIDGSFYLGSGWPDLLVRILMDGTEVWRVNTCDYNHSVVAAIDENHVYVGGHRHVNDNSCGIHKHDGGNGSLIWRRIVGPPTWTGRYGVIAVHTGMPSKAPIANAGPNLTIESEEQLVTVIQGIASDPDNDPLTYRWLEGQTVLTPWQDVGPNGEAYIDLNTLSYITIGQHTLTLEVSDGIGAFSDNMILIIENSSPHAAPTGSGTYAIWSPVWLSGQVSDFDGDDLAYLWSENGVEFFSGSATTSAGGDPVELPEHIISNLSIGVHVLTLNVNDGVNDPATGDITVEIVDTTVPTLAPVPNKSILWPPNHQMVDIVIEANASDNSGGPVVLSAKIQSNEPEEGLGDGDAKPDWNETIIDQDNGIITFQLRSERSGSGEGRIYTVEITATDESGNFSSADVEIIVPHDKGK